MKKILFILFIVVLLINCTPTENAKTEETKTQPQEEKTMKKEIIEPLAMWIWQNKEGTEEDTMIIRFYKETAPGHVENFIKLADKGFYNGNVIFRVEPGFVIQTGSPDNTNTGGPGYTIDAEFNDIKHLKGTLAMARAMDPNSAGSQYYFALAPLPMLDKKYTVFGQVIENVDLLDKIKKGDYVKEIKIIDARDYYGDNYKTIVEEKDIHNKLNNENNEE